MRPTARVTVPAILLIALSGYLSLNVFQEWGEAVGSGQRVATITQAAYCVLGVLAGLAALWQRRALAALLGLWLLAITATAALAPVVWGGASWGVGVISGLAGGAVGLLIVWWLLAASAPSLWEAGARRELAQRLARLRPETRAVWGRMNCPQMLAHVNDQLRMAMGDLAVKQERLPIRYPPLKQIIVYALRWPRGLPTAPELIARIDRASWDAEVAVFPGLLDAFAARRADATWPMHPAFGRLSRLGWGVLGYRHTDHHFRQFGA